MNSGSFFSMGGVLLVIAVLILINKILIKPILKTIFRIILILLGIAFLYSFFSKDANAEGLLDNGYEKSYVYQSPEDGKTYGATITIQSSSGESWNLRYDLENNEIEDNYVYKRLSADGKTGDTITATITSEYDGTFLGLTIMPREDGKWKEGVQYTSLAGSSEKNTITKDVTVEPGVSDIQITLSAHNASFVSKKPGCMDIVFTLEMEGHNASVQKSSNVGKTLLTIFACAMFLIILAGVLTKINKRKNKLTL